MNSSIPEYKFANSLNRNLLNPCFYHPEEQICFVCEKCKSLICIKCKIGHQGHKSFLLESQILEKYKILEFLGRGSFGKVFSGKEFMKMELVALKIIDNVKPADYKFAMNELKIHSQVDHKNIIRYISHEYLEEEERLVIILELADSSLEKIVNEITQEHAFDFFVDVCLGLEYLHSLGIMHRDLKLGNVLVKNGKAMISDFGEAISLSTSSFRSNQVFGTKTYWPPELFNGEKYNAKADVWALGILFHKMLTKNIHPFDDDFEKIKKGEITIHDSIKNPEILRILKGCLNPIVSKRLSIKKLIQLLKYEEETLAGKRSLKTGVIIHCIKDPMIEALLGESQNLDDQNENNEKNQNFEVTKNNWKKNFIIIIMNLGMVSSSASFLLLVGLLCDHTKFFSFVIPILFYSLSNLGIIELSKSARTWLNLSDLVSFSITLVLIILQLVYPVQITQINSSSLDYSLYFYQHISDKSIAQYFLYSIIFSFYGFCIGINFLLTPLYIQELIFDSNGAVFSQMFFLVGLSFFQSLSYYQIDINVFLYIILFINTLRFLSAFWIFKIDSAYYYLERNDVGQAMNSLSLFFDSKTVDLIMEDFENQNISLLKNKKSNSHIILILMSLLSFLLLSLMITTEFVFLELGFLTYVIRSLGVIFYHFFLKKYHFLKVLTVFILPVVYYSSNIFLSAGAYVLIQNFIMGCFFCIPFKFCFFAFKNKINFISILLISNFIFWILFLIFPLIIGNLFRWGFLATFCLILFFAICYRKRGYYNFFLR